MEIINKLSTVSKLGCTIKSCDCQMLIIIHDTDLEKLCGDCHHKISEHKDYGAVNI